MNLIVAVCSEWGIGKNNSILFSLPEDMNFFKQMTMGKTVIMGRKTLDSFPGGRPLKGRTNVVLTRNPSFTREGAIVCRSAEEVAEQIKGLPDDEVIVIGGEEIYRLFLPLCRKAFVTKVDTCVPDADSFFPNLDLDPEWTLTSASETMEENGHRFRFCEYQSLR